MKAKCHFERESENLYGGGALSRFRVLESELARAWGLREKGVARGGAPLMRGAHKTCAKLKRVASGERGRGFREGAHLLERGRHMLK
jgi:hypothetical protein